MQVKCVRLRPDGRLGRLFRPGRIREYAIVFLVYILPNEVCTATTIDHEVCLPSLILQVGGYRSSITEGDTLG